MATPVKLPHVRVVDAALSRLIRLYEGGHQVVVSFSGGKDSGVVLELAIEAARRTGRLPVDVAMRDEEIMLPGTFEYAERVASRPEVRFRWVIQRQPCYNLFNRHLPYYWPFDPYLDPSQWMREPPSYAVWDTERLGIEYVINEDIYPPEEGTNLYILIGLRAAESLKRQRAMTNMLGYSSHVKGRTYYAYPIYDWSDGDVWRFILEGGYDYNRAYDALYRLGVPRRLLRIAPPAMSLANLPALRAARLAWPGWWERLCERLSGIREAVLYGRRAYEPQRRLGETWEQAYQRLCIDEAPAWIRRRAERVREVVSAYHARHSSAPIPEVQVCLACTAFMRVSWRSLTHLIYNGDPFSMRFTFLPQVEPEEFRPNAGRWGGKATW